MAQTETYRQLTYEERCQIQALKGRGDSNRQIARQLGRHRRTIDREVSRNSGQRGYRHQQAQAKSYQRRHQPKPHLVKLTLDLRLVIRDKLTQSQWSPEQVSGWLKREGLPHVSHERIYQFIWANKAVGGDLYTHLRRKARKYQKRINGKSARGQIISRVDIAERPAIVDTRNRIGDWEADTIVGKAHQGAIVSLIERKTRYTKLVKVDRSTAAWVQQAITQALSALPVKTITFDNGKEFAHHQTIGQTLKAETYFAQPYHSWERGTNENTNGLVRQYLPKKTDFRHITQADVDRIEHLLNTRPRKCLHYNTPARAIQAVA
jgi:IS30 family transposase